MIYSDLKAIIARKNLAWQHDDLEDRYNLFAVDPGGMRYEATAFKPNAVVVGIDPVQEAANVADFETNYKDHSNFAIGVRTYPFSTSDMQFAGEGFSGVAAHGAQTDLFFKLANGYYLTGGDYWTIGAAAGDLFQVDVVDKDGLYAPAGTVLVSPAYMKAWNVLPKDSTLIKFERTYAGKPPPGVYLRFRYTSVGGADVNFFCNLYLHKPL